MVDEITKIYTGHQGVAIRAGKRSRAMPPKIRLEPFENFFWSFHEPGLVKKAVPTRQTILKRSHLVQAGAGSRGESPFRNAPIRIHDPEAYEVYRV